MSIGMKLRDLLSGSLIVLAVWTALAFANDPRPVKVGIPPSQSESNEPSGLAVDVINDIARAEEWRVTFVQELWPTLLQRLEAGEIDIMTGISYSKKRAQRFDFTSETLFSNWGMIYRSFDVKINTVLDLGGKRLAVLEKGIHHRAISSMLKKFSVTYVPIIVNSYKEAVAHVEKGEADAAVVSRDHGILHGHKYDVVDTTILFNPVEVRFATTKGKGADFRAAIDSYLSTEKNNPKSSYHEHLKRWLKTPVQKEIPKWLIWSSGAALVGLCMTLAIIWLLRRQVKLQTAELRESEHDLKIRDRIAEIFLTTSSEDMYGEVLKVILDAMESPYGTFAYINEDGDRIVPSMTRDIWDVCKMPDKDIFFPSDSWGDNLWARCLIEKKSFFSNGPFKIPEGHIQIKRAMATPVIYQGESIGNLMVGDKPSNYSEKNMKLLETIADHIAPIMHARLVNEKNQRRREHDEEQIKESLKEKEVLLREIHHRVKNNMQIIISLLKLQSGTVKDKQVIDALVNSQMRVQAMASVHETLYSTESLAAIDFKTYASKLAGTIFQTYGTSSSRVELKIEAEDIVFEIEKATPVGLIINELVSNALKHAFPDNRSGEITIRLNKIKEDEIELVVGDNGIGLPEAFDFRNSDTLGFKLVKIIAETQLDGNIELDRKGGSHFNIRFKLEDSI